jgi:hypothetical protein
MSYKCPFCSRTFSTKSGYSQHTSICQPSSSDSSEESSLITDVNNMSLDSEGFTSEIYMNETNNVNQVFIYFFVIKEQLNSILTVC